MTLPINPSGRTLGTQNAILSGYGTRYHVRDFEGCLSLKSVVRDCIPPIVMRRLKKMRGEY